MEPSTSLPGHHGPVLSPGLLGEELRAKQALKMQKWLGSAHCTCLSPAGENAKPGSPKASDTISVGGRADRKGEVP